jgi:hypothetical protein
MGEQEVMSAEELLRGSQLTDSENSRYATIKRVAIANRKSESQRHADAIGAIDAREMFDLQQLANAVQRRNMEAMGEKHGR